MDLKYKIADTIEIIFMLVLITLLSFLVVGVVSLAGNPLLTGIAVLLMGGMIVISGFFMLYSAWK